MTTSFLKKFLPFEEISSFWRLRVYDDMFSIIKILYQNVKISQLGTEQTSSHNILFYSNTLFWRNFFLLKILYHSKDLHLFEVISSLLRNFSLLKIDRNAKIFQPGTTQRSEHKFHFTKFFIPISSHPLKMKTSSTTGTGISMINIANVTLKVAAFAFFLASLFGVVYGNSYVSLYKIGNIFRSHSRARIC